MSRKTVTFYFCNNFVKLFYIETLIKTQPIFYENTTTLRHVSIPRYAGVL